MEKELDKSIWFCGDTLSAADIQMSFALEAASVRTDMSEKCPSLAAFLERMQALPTYRAALEKGGPYQLLGAA
jgi:glutathione S-transferase